MLQEVLFKAKRYYGIIGSMVADMLRLGKFGALVVQQGAGEAEEAADRGALFYASTPGAGVAPGTSVGTTAAYAIGNPAASDVDLVIRRVYVAYGSGTIGGGNVVACKGVYNATAITGGSGITPIGGGGGVSKATVQSGSTLPNTPSVVVPVASLGARLATTVTDVVPAVVHDFKGGLRIAPGETFSLQGVAAAGSTPLLVLAAEWEERPRG